MKPSERLYHRYEYLAVNFANKLHSYENTSLEKCDVLQELKIKIYTSIKAYARRWKKYRADEARKPVPLKNYLCAALGNRTTDLMRKITLHNNKVRMSVVDYDYGRIQDSQISPEGNNFIVNGVDLLERLSGKERLIFSMFLRGYNVGKLNRLYYSTEEEKKNRRLLIESGDTPITAKDIIENQQKYLISNYGSDLLQHRQMYSTYKLQD